MNDLQMTKGELLKLMEEWSDNTIVIMSSWPFVADIQAVQREPKHGVGRIILDRDSWRMSRTKPDVD